MRPQGRPTWPGGWKLAAHLARREWRLLLPVALGILLTSVVLAAIPTLLDSLAELGLAHRVGLERVDLLDIQVLATDRPASRRDYTRADDVVARALDERLGTLQRDRVQYGKSASFFTKRQPQDPVSATAPRANLFFLQQFEEHVRVPQGKLPAFPAAGTDIEAAVGTGAARSLGVQVGDRLMLVPFASEPDNALAVSVTGFVEPLDRSEEFWLGNTLHFEAQADPVADITTVPLYVRQEAFLDVMGARYPTVLADYWWNVYIWPQRITAKDLDRTQSGVETLRAAINKGVPRSTTFTRLDDVLREHRRQVTLTRAPLWLLLSLLTLTAAYYTALLGGLLVQRLSSDIALWKSRGARWRTIVATFGALGLAPAALGLALGPPLALGLVAAAGLFGPLHPVSGGTALPVRWLAASYAFAGLGTALSLAGFLVPALMAARRTLVEARDAESRPPRLPGYQRYYLDLPVLVATALLTWQAAAKGSVFGRPLQGKDLSLDPVFLVLPALLAASVLLVTARVFPGAGSLLSAVAGRLASAAPSAAWRRLARDPSPHFAVAALLVLVASLISFSATLSGSLERSYRERLLYQAGAGAKVTGLGDRSASDDETLRDLSGVPGVALASPVLRTRARLGATGGGEEFTVLAVEPATLAQLAWFRPDLGAADMAELLEPLKPRTPPEPVPLPQDAIALGVWVYAERELPEAKLYVRLLGGPRGPEELELGLVPPQGWRLLRADLPAELAGGQQLKLTSLYLVQARSSMGPPAGAILFDDLTAYGSREQAGTVLEGFEEIGRWEALPHRGFSPDKLEPSSAQARSGQRALRLSWTSSLAGEPRGLLARRTAVPLPGIASSRLVGLTGQPAGERFLANVDGSLVPVAARATAALFPTVEADREPFLVVDRRTLLKYLEGLPRSRPSRTTEAWLSLKPGTGSPELLTELQARFPGLGRSDVVLAPQLLAELQGDPLGPAGWAGFLAATVALAALLGVLGCALAMAAAGSRSALEFAVLRACGFSRPQLLATLVIEYLLSAAAGLVAGGALGHGLARLVLTLLDVNERGRPVLPPIAVELGWATVAPLLLALFVVVVAITVVLGVALGRGAIGARLRVSR
jgi:ABC-type lipoprotein release transport system permease subunit